MLGVSQKWVGAPLCGKHTASLFLKGTATVRAERHTRLELLHKLCRESNQFVLFMVFKTKCNEHNKAKNIIESKSSQHAVVSEQKGNDCSHVTCQVWLFIVFAMFTHFPTAKNKILLSSLLKYSLCNEPLIELSNPGASGSIFYVSSDDEFIIKTVQHKEAEFLQKLLPGYFMVSLRTENRNLKSSGVTYIIYL